MKVITLLLVTCYLLVSPLQASQSTNNPNTVERFQLLEVKQGGLLILYKIDTQTGETWVMMPGTTDGFVPVKTTPKLKAEKAETPDSFIPDPDQ